MISPAPTGMHVVDPRQRSQIMPVGHAHGDPADSRDCVKSTAFMLPGAHCRSGATRLPARNVAAQIMRAMLKNPCETCLQQECNLSPTPDTVEKAVAAAASGMVKLGTRNYGHRTVTWKGATPCGCFLTLTFKGI